MACRAKKIPPGILTLLKVVGRIIDQVENRSEAAAIGVGLELPKFSGESVKKLNDGIGAIVASAVKDKKHHDITIASSEAAAGITVHCNDLPIEIADEQLRTPLRTTQV
jgi:hypothetical protein